MKRLAWLFPLLLAGFAPAAAHAADGYVTASVSLRAGPDIGYPRIDVIPAGRTIDIYGCTDGWDWCDVSYLGDRGWVAGNYIEFIDSGYYRPLPQYGAQIGIPIVTFVIANYWGRYYSHRPFYRERHTWYARPMPHRPPPPPPSRPWHRPDHGGRPGATRPPSHPSRPPSQGHRPNPPPRPQPRPATPTHPQPRPAVQSPRPQPHPATAPQQTRPAPAARPAPKPAPSHGNKEGHGKPPSKDHDDRGR